MPPSWKITALAPSEIVEAALLAHEEAADWDPDIVLAGSEIAEDGAKDWRLEAWLPRKPREDDLRAVAALLAPYTPELVTEMLPQADWTTLSQQHLAPLQEGPFYIRTPHCAPPDTALARGGVRPTRDLVIPASAAFGTGHHPTTSGCLAMLGAMKARGVQVRNLADIGTGTGLLALAALHLWPRALATASDIDALCVPVVEENAKVNGVPLGGGAGEVTMVVAAGLDHPLLQARGPYDLVLANILAGPLIDLAPEFARALVPGGSLLVSGLLTAQEAKVRAACRRHRLRLAARMPRGEWSILWLRRRREG